MTQNWTKELEINNLIVFKDNPFKRRIIIMKTTDSWIVKRNHCNEDIFKAGNEVGEFSQKERALKCAKENMETYIPKW